MKIYLAGNIKDNEKEAESWRRKLKAQFPFNLILFIDPLERNRINKSFKIDFYRPNEIVRLDKQDILNSDIVLAKVDKPTFGTAMEICFAYENKIPVILVSKIEDMSPWLKYHVDKIFEKESDAVKWIMKTFLRYERRGKK